MYSNSIYGDKLFLLNNLYLKSDNGMLKIAVRIMINKRKIIKIYKYVKIAIIKKIL